MATNDLDVGFNKQRCQSGSYVWTFGIKGKMVVITGEIRNGNYKNGNSELKSRVADMLKIHCEGSER